MNSLFVPYELAVKLKEKGFNEPCLGYYSNNHLYFLDVPEGQKSFDVSNKIRNEKLQAAPLWQQVIDWLREEKGIFIQITIEKEQDWWYTLINSKNGFGLLQNGNFISEIAFDNYYSALRSGIEKALELI